ncbi:MAG: tetratricopeptide repeat protein [Candidatus Cloacimonetes bacterium]|nr:tetratricopeptide repeat protein [Candidatus Cloacimonadota bacterium]
MQIDISKTTQHSVLVYYILIILIGILIFGILTTYDFVWDDKDPNLIENKYLQNPSLKNIAHFWIMPYAQMYIPMSYTSWALVKEIGQLLPFGNSVDGFNPFAFHLFNILFHILNSILVFKILRLLIKGNLPCFIGALFFLLHPLQVETVAWITEFRGLMSAFFGFSSLYILLKNDVYSCKDLSSKCLKIRYINSLILFVLGMLSKPSVAVISIIGFLIYLFYFKIDVWQSFKKVIPFIIITIPFVFILRYVQPSSFHTEVAPIWSRFFIWMDTINFYLLKTIIPYPLVTTYTRTFQNLLPHFWFYLEWIIPPLLVFLAIRADRKNRILFLGLLIFIAGFLPVSGLISFVFQKWSNVADRYVYFSMFGFGLIIAWLLDTYRKKLIWVPIIIVLLLFTILTRIVQIPVWKNSLILWSHALTHGEPNTYAYNNRGIAFQKSGDYKNALEDFKKSIILNSLHTKSYYNIGIVYAENARPDSAITYYSKAIDQKVDYVDAYLNRGVAYNHLKQYDKALKDFNFIININPNDEMAYSNRGIVYLELHKYGYALKDFSRAIILNPNRAQTYYLRGKVKNLIGNKEGALSDFNAALNLKPDLIDALVQRAMLYEAKGNYEAAIIDALKSYRLNKDKLDSVILLGDLLTKKGDLPIAIDFYSHAISIEPKNAEIYKKRAVVYYLLGKYIKSNQDVLQAEQLGATIRKSFLESLREKL